MLRCPLNSSRFVARITVLFARPVSVTSLPIPGHAQPLFRLICQPIAMATFRSLTKISLSAKSWRCHFSRRTSRENGFSVLGAAFCTFMVRHHLAATSSHHRLDPKAVPNPLSGRNWPSAYTSGCNRPAGVTDVRRCFGKPGSAPGLVLRRQLIYIGLRSRRAAVRGRCGRVAFRSEHARRSRGSSSLEGRTVW